MSGLRVRLRFQCFHALRELGADSGEQGHVHAHAVLFDAREHRHQRHLDGFEELMQGRGLLQPRVERLMQAQGDVGILRGIGGGGFDGHLVERELVATAPGDVLEVNGAVLQMLLGEAVHVVAAEACIEHETLEHGVEAHPLHSDTMAPQHMQVVLDVLPYLGFAGIFEQRAQALEHLRHRQLLWCADVAMGERYIPAAPRGHGKSEPHQPGAVTVQRVGLGVQTQQRRRLKLPQHGLEALPGQHRLGDRSQGGRERRGRFGRRRCGGRGRGARFLLPAAKAQSFIQGGERSAIARRTLQSRQRHRQFQVAADAREFARQPQLVEAVAQVLAGLAGQLGGVCHEAVERAVLAEPAGGGLGPHQWHARNVVGGITGQRQKIGDAFRAHAEALAHRGRVEAAFLHGVEQGHTLVDQLSKVLVAGDDQHLRAHCQCLLGQGSDDIVGLDPRHLQDRQAHGVDELENHRKLRAQIRRHRLPVRLVLGEEIVAKGFSGRIEHHHDLLAGVIAQQPAQHVAHAVHGAGGFARRAGQRRQRVEGAIEPA